MNVVIKFRKTIIRLFLSTFAICFIFSFYYSSYIVVDKYISEISGNIIITAVVREDLPEDSLNPVIKDINSYYWVKNARLIKPDKGLVKTDSSIGGISGDLLPENPLPALIYVSIKDEYLNRFNLAKYNLLIKKIDIVENTILRKDYADTVFLIRNQFSALSIITGVLLGMIILLIVFLSMNPEFVKLKEKVELSSEIISYYKSARELLGLFSSVVSISIAVSSGFIYLLWYLLVREIPWFINAPWQILLWNLAFVMLVYELEYLVLYLIYKPKVELGIKNEELGIRNEELEIKNEELGIRNEELEINEPEAEIQKSEEIRNEELGIRNSQQTKEETLVENQDKKEGNQEEEISGNNNESENWEDDIT